MTLTIEVAFSRPMSRLPDAGMMAGMACGSTIRRKIRLRPRPRASAASDCPRSTERIPPRTISAENAAVSTVRPTNAARIPVNRWAVRTVTNSWPNGIPSDSCGYSEAISYQNSSCTSGGTERTSHT